MAQHEESNRESNYDSQYQYDDYSDEDEVSELDVASSVRARFVSKDFSETKVERGKIAMLECAVDRWIFFKL